MTPTHVPGQRHVMQVVYSLDRAGSERVACDLALTLDPSRFRSSVCALSHGGPLAEPLKERAVPSHVVGCKPGAQWHVIPQLYRLFRASRVDVVQTHHLKQLMYSLIGARLAGAALVHVEHEYFTLKAPRERRRLRWTARLCHRVVAVGEEIRQFLVREAGLPPHKVVVIRNAVDTTRYAPRARASREACGLPRGRLIGHVARLEAEKDQQTLLRAFRIVLERCGEARLLIVGDGSRRAQLHESARSLGIGQRVEFLGLRHDVAELLPHVDAFVLSSVNEGLPMAVLEAMACARPVVATAVGELPRVIHDGITGLTVPPGDPAPLAAALAVVLERPAWAAAMGRAGRRLIEEQFSLTASVAQYEALYESLLHRNGEVGLATPATSP